jgi:2-(1,2-epoxy-1,2-dihydrophenyl)acetyl-CoA isomerase
VITGAGRGFCSGQDLRAAAGDGGLDVGTILRDHYTPAIRAIRSMDQPVIAAVNGVAAGAGFSLALACDLRIAADSATFVQAFVRIGLIPDLASTYFLPRLIGPARAAELAMLGETVDASRALELGIVNRVVPDAELADAAAELAGRLARGPRSIGLTKRALDVSHENDLEAQLAVEERLQTEATTTSS